MMLKVFFSKTVMGKLGRDPAFFDHVRDVLRSFAQGQFLVLDRDIFIVFDQRVTADCDDS